MNVDLSTFRNETGLSNKDIAKAMAGLLTKIEVNGMHVATMTIEDRYDYDRIMPKAAIVRAKEIIMQYSKKT